jgi:hypothetical protein
MLTGKRVHDFVRADALCQKGGDKRAGAGPHIDIEIVDGAVYQQVVNGAERADFINRAGQTTPGKHKRGFGAGVAMRSRHQRVLVEERDNAFGTSAPRKRPAVGNRNRTRAALCAVSMCLQVPGTRSYMQCNPKWGI